MALINYATREINAKVVYYGPGLCGKTTNIEQVYALIKDTGKGKLVTLPTQTDRTLFFDFLPMELGTLKGFKVRIHLYTVPGQVFYNSTRKMVLKGADGIVFVADSQREMANENFRSLKNLEENLSESGLHVGDIPMVMQYNKRDLKDCASVEELQSGMNRQGFQMYEAAAKDGTGVMETLTGIVKLVLMDLKDRPDVHNLDMTALDRGGEDKVRVIRGEFTSITPDDDFARPPSAGEYESDLNYADTLDEAELLEAEEHIEAVEFMEQDEEPLDFKEHLEPEDHMEADELIMEEEFADYEDEPGGDAGFDDLWSGPAGEPEEAIEPAAGEAEPVEEGRRPGVYGLTPFDDIPDPIAGLEMDTLAGHGSIDFDALTKDIAKAQLETAGDEGLAASITDRPVGDSREFSSDEIAVFRDIVTPLGKAPAAREEQPVESSPLMDIDSDKAPEPVSNNFAPVATVLVPEKKTPTESFRIHQSFTLPVKIASSVGQREISLKFDLSVELQGEGVGEEIGIQILPPRPQGRPEITDGHPPPEAEDDPEVASADERNDAFDRLMNQ